jgi:adiponectin receptor
MSFSQFFTPRRNSKISERSIPDYDYIRENIIDSDTIQVIDSDSNGIEYKHLPSWYKDNPYILKYYRGTNRSLKYYIKSIFWIHNETFNIWTHILASCLFLSFLIVNVSIPPYRVIIEKYVTQAIVFYGNIMSSFICFTLSYIMHIFYPMNERVCYNLMVLDYMGIFINITGTASAFIYFSFYCQIIYQQLYFILLLSITVLLLVIFICYGFFVLPNQRRWRAILFSIYGICILIPIIHRFSIKDENDSYFLDELRYFMLSGLSFIIGIGIYVSQIPERFYPGKFDKIGSSHTIFHIFMLTDDILCTYGLWIIMRKETDNMVC